MRTERKSAVWRILPADLFWASLVLSDSKRTATPIFVSAGADPAASRAPAGRTTRNTWPRQRTGMFSPSVISEGIFNESSISEPSVTAASVKKKTPRELRSWVNPTPSTEVPGWRSESGSRYGNRCPARRSIPAGGVVIVGPFA